MDVPGQAARRQRPQRCGLLAARGMGPRPRRLRRDAARCLRRPDRVRDRNRNGILASMCFATFTGFSARHLNVTREDVALVMVSAYNDWHIDEWAGSYPGRFIPIAVLPTWNPEAMCAEIRRVAAKGCRAVLALLQLGSFRPHPQGAGIRAGAARQRRRRRCVDPVPQGMGPSLPAEPTGGSLKLPTSCSAFAERVTGLEPVYTALQAAA
jgi:hypothetical protein